MAAEIRDLPRRFYDEVISTGDVDRVEEFCTPDFVNHEEGPPDLPEGSEGAKAVITMYREAFPDLRAKVEDTVVEGDKVVVRGTFTGTHQGDFIGIPARGKPIEVEGIEILRVEGGRVAERWAVTDMIGLMQQIGAIPAETAG